MRTLVALILIATALAGCSDAPGPAPVDEDPANDVQVEVTETTGAIRGVVIDEAVVPIVGATVTLVGPGLSTTTNENGAFGFSKLEPGTYFIDAEKVGFNTVQQSTTVAAGVENPPVVKMLLTRDPTSAPTVVVLQWDGYIECGLSVIALCALPVVDETVGDDFSHSFELDRDGVTYLQSEMIWETTQTVSPNMQLWQEASGSGGCTFSAQNAPSPNIINTTYGDYNEHGSRSCFESLGNTTDLSHRVFSGSIDGTFPPTEDGCYPLVITKLCTGVGATLEQSFTVFNHVFYGFKPAEGWTFGKDGTPPTPE